MIMWIRYMYMYNFISYIAVNALTTEVGHKGLADVDCTFLGQSGCGAARGTSINLSLYSVHPFLIKCLSMYLTHVV